MALDSQQKRMSAAGIARPWMRAVFPVASPTAAWRQNVGLSYSGVTVTSVTVTDNRTVAGHFAVSFDSGDAIRVRKIRTEGGSNLQTKQDQSSLSVIVYGPSGDY